MFRIMQKEKLNYSGVRYKVRSFNQSERALSRNFILIKYKNYRTCNNILINLKVSLTTLLKERRLRGHDQPSL